MFKSDFERPAEGARDRRLWDRLDALLACRDTLGHDACRAAWHSLVNEVVSAEEATPELAMRMAGELFLREEPAWSRQLLLRALTPEDVSTPLLARTCSRLSRVVPDAALSTRLLAAAWRLSRLAGLSEDRDLLHSILTNGVWCACKMRRMDVAQAERALGFVERQASGSAAAVRALCGIASVATRFGSDVRETLAHLSQAMHAARAYATTCAGSEAALLIAGNIYAAGSFLRKLGMRRTEAHVLKRGLNETKDVPHAWRWQVRFLGRLQRSDPPSVELPLDGAAAPGQDYRLVERVLRDPCGDASLCSMPSLEIARAPATHDELRTASVLSSLKGGLEPGLENAAAAVYYADASHIATRFAERLNRPVRLPRRSEIEALWTAHSWPEEARLAPWPEAYRPHLEALRTGLLRIALRDRVLPGLRAHPFQHADVLHEWAMADDEPNGRAWLFHVEPDERGSARLVWRAVRAEPGRGPRAAFRICMPVDGKGA